MAPKHLFTFSLTLHLFLLSLTTALPPETIANAADTLSNSGYISMSLTLNLLSTSILSHTPSATIFTPPDSIFTTSGQPPLSLLQLHISPLLFSLSTLRSLPPGTTLPSISSHHHLTITPPPFSDQVSINNVNIIGSPVFDDGLLIIFAIDNFFDPDFQFADSPMQIDSFNDCETSHESDNKFSFHDAGNVLISRGYSVMASFLNLQLLGFQSQPRLARLTVFAPVDEVLVDYSNRFPDYASLFLRHVLPCTISWRELDDVNNGTRLSTYLDGFTITVTRSGVKVMVNKVPVVFPDMYYSDWLVIHGIPEAFSLPEEEEEEEGDSDGGDFDSVRSGNDAEEVTVVADSARTEF